MLKRLIFLLFIFNFTILQAAFNGQRAWNTRARGMGHAYTAVSNDSGAILYNVAGLAHVNFSELYFLHADIYSSLDGVSLATNYLSFIQPLDIGTIALNYYQFADRDLYFEDYLGLNYGMMILPNLSAGIGVAFLEHGYKNVDQYTSDANDPVFAHGTKKDAYAINFGLLYDFEYFSVGASANNVNRPDIGLKDKDIIPADYRLGVAFNYDRLTIPFDISYRDQYWGGDESNKIAKYLGLEWGLTDVFKVRGGMNDYEASLGCSFFEKEMFATIDLGIDYSLSFPFEIEDTIGTHQISLFFRFGQTEITDTLNFYDYTRIHPNFKIREGISSFSGDSSDLLFNDDLVLRFYAEIKGETPYDRVSELVYKLSEIMKFEILTADDIKIETFKNKKVITILDRIIIPINEDAYLMDIEVKYLANQWISNLKEILLINEKKEIKTEKVSDIVFVEQAYTATGEVAAIFVNDKKIFTLYAEGKNDKPVFDKAVDFAKIIDLYLDGGLEGMVIGSTSEYGEYYLTIKGRDIFYINPEAKFLNMDENDLIVEYQDLLYGILL
ncbi:MAG: type IX secretion system membrane protein PorP/SprF [bacterium]|nr:type IX secretion system membrane protein PorP/SprF [bacterium]